MSSTYGKNKKELSGVKVVSAAEVWRKNYKNGKFSLRKDIDILGKVEKSDRPNIGRSVRGPTFSALRSSLRLREFTVASLFGLWQK